MTRNGGESGRNSPSVASYTLAAFNAAAAVFIAITAMQGDAAKEDLNRIRVDIERNRNDISSLQRDVAVFRDRLERRR